MCLPLLQGIAFARQIHDAETSPRHAPMSPADGKWSIPVYPGPKLTFENDDAPRLGNQNHTRLIPLKMRRETRPKVVASESSNTDGTEKCDGVSRRPRRIIRCVHKDDAEFDDPR